MHQCFDFIKYFPIEIPEKFMKIIKERLKFENDICNEESLNNLQVKIPVCATYNKNIRIIDNTFQHYVILDKNKPFYIFRYNHSCENIIVICNNKIFLFEKNFLKLQDKDINVIYEDIKTSSGFVFQHYSEYLKSKNK